MVLVVDSTVPAGAGDDEATLAYTGGDEVTQISARGYEVTQPSPSGSAVTRSSAGDVEATGISPGSHEATRVSAGNAEAALPSTSGDAVTRTWMPGAASPHSSNPGAEVVHRYGPGVPATPSAERAATTAEQVWRTGRLAGPPRRRARLRRLLGSSLTVILLAASAVVLYLRFHHAPFHVTGVIIAQQTKTNCGVDVTGRITTNGTAGTVSYQWVFRPDTHAPQPLYQSAIAGQHDVYVTVAVEGSGHGTASQTVTLQILGPDPRSVSAPVVISC